MAGGVDPFESSRAKIFIGTVVLAVAAAIAVLLSSWASIDPGDLLFTAGCGAILALLTVATPAGRVGAFAIGIVVAWVSYGVRAALLPDTVVAQAIVILVAIIIVGGIAGLSRGRVPLSAGLLGLVAMTGGYDAVFAAAPYEFISSSTATVGTVIAGAAVGALSVIVAEFIADVVKTEPAAPSAPPTAVGPSDVPPARPLTDPSSPSPIFDAKK